MKTDKLQWLDIPIEIFAAEHSLNLTPVPCPHCRQAVPYTRPFIYQSSFAGIMVDNHGCPPEANANLLVPIDCVDRARFKNFAKKLIN